MLYTSLGFAQETPIPGTGSGGAYGPSVWTLSDRAATPASTPIPILQHPPITTSTSSSAALASPLQIQSSNATYIDSSEVASALAAAGSATSTQSVVNSSFTAQWGSEGLSAATNGTYIISSDVFGILTAYTMTGGGVRNIPYSVGAVLCPNGSTLPVCTENGFSGNGRIVWDSTFHNWVVSAKWCPNASLCIGGNGPIYDLVAVSATNDPTGTWYGYQFPACGAFDTWDGSDYPLLGFNDYWITITSACSCSHSVNGAGLAVFAKSDLYTGTPLTLNSNWWEFVDGFSGGPYCNLSASSVNSRDLPVRTFSPDTYSREYLATAYYGQNSEVGAVYSYLQALDPATSIAPVLYSAAETVTTGVFAPGNASTPGGHEGADSIPLLATPDNIACLLVGPPDCMIDWINGWLQSGGVWQLSNNDPYIVTTQVSNAAQFTNETQITSIATDLNTNISTSINLAGGELGSGPMAAEIALPYPVGGSKQLDHAIIGYSMTRSDFGAGVKDFEWDIDNNSVMSINILQNDLDVPEFSNCEAQGRWIEGLDAAYPIPGTGNLILGGPYGYEQSDSECANYFATITVP